MNWGTAITVFYISFAVSIVGAVFASRKHAPIMVSKDYYNLDLQYQQRMQKKINAASLSVGVKSHYDASQKTAVLTFPVDAGQPAGIIRLICPSNPDADFNVPVQTDEKGNMSVVIPAGNGSLWRMESEWAAGGKEYFHEGVIYL